MEWLSELKRITRPGALLLLTVHGADLVPEECRDVFQQSGFLYLAGHGTFGLPDFYQTSFHGVEYIERNWSSFFKIEDIVPKGVNGHQDLILCRRF